jgi:DNA-binding NarL/FixJ family response regulator
MAESRSKNKIRIIVADDHEIVRHGVRNLLESENDLHVVAEATTGRSAVQLCEKHQPDLAILDLGMPDLNGMEATRQIRKACPDTRVLIFTMHETERLVQEVFQAGAQAYVLKSDAGKHLIHAIRTVHRGEHFFSSKVTEVIFEGFLRSASGESNTPSTDDAVRPTAREREILQMLAEGKSNKEVAQTLGISVKTAETHRAAIMRKLKLNSLSDLVRYAIRHHIIEA